MGFLYFASHALSLSLSEDAVGMALRCRLGCDQCDFIVYKLSSRRCQFSSILLSILLFFSNLHGLRSGCSQNLGMLMRTFYRCQCTTFVKRVKICCNVDMMSPFQCSGSPLRTTLPENDLTISVPAMATTKLVCLKLG